MFFFFLCKECELRFCSFPVKYGCELPDRSRMIWQEASNKSASRDTVHDELVRLNVQVCHFI